MIKHSHSNQAPRWGDNYQRFGFLFGKGWTVAIINHGVSGREIHVQSSVPMRHITTAIMDSFSCDWFTTIAPSNRKAINLAAKTGFTFVRGIKVKCISSGNFIKMNLYKRSKL